MEVSDADQDRRRVALVERLSVIADLCCENPLGGPQGDVAYELLRQAAAQIASDRQALSTQSAELDALRGEVAKQNGELYAKATPRPWEVDSERDADGPDRHTYYKMFGPDGKVLFDTLNSDVAYLHTDIDYDADGPWEHVWDEQGRVNFELVAHAVNNIEDYEATISQLRDRVAGLEKSIAPSERGAVLIIRVDEFDCPNELNIIQHQSSYHLKCGSKASPERVWYVIQDEFSHANVDFGKYHGSRALLKQNEVG